MRTIPTRSWNHHFNRCLFPPGNVHRGAAGFTFIEIILVIGLLGILFGLAAVKFDGLIPRYRLRSAVRELGTDVEGHRVTAISRGVWLGIRYTMEVEETYYQLIPPPPKEYPSQPVQDRTPKAKKFFPGDNFAGVRILSVSIRGSDDVYESGSVLILFSPNGTSGSHTVTFGNEEGQTWTMQFNAITGTVDFLKNEEVGFEDFEG